MKELRLRISRKVMCPEDPELGLVQISYSAADDLEIVVSTLARKTWNLLEPLR
jgi:hypothetical protein